MKQSFHKIPFLRPAAAFSIGIFTGSYFQVNSVILYVALIIIVCLLFWMNSNYSFKKTIWFGVGMHLFFLGTGLLIYQNYNRKPEFYKNGKFVATVLEILQEKPNSYQSVLEIRAIKTGDSLIYAKEKIIVWFEKTEESKSLKPGEMIVFNKQPQIIKNSLNPFEFDYKRYMARKKIHRQIYLSSHNWALCELQSPVHLSIFAQQARLRFLEIYAQQKWNKHEMELISALTLGYKQGLDPDIKRIFTSAGAMHVLAVSGLHVGILYLVFNVVLGFLRKQRIGRIVFCCLVICSLWIFAFITGLSPSVKRAATMFTFLIIGLNLKKQLNTYNTLAVSAFFLLLFNPNNLFDAGFQLSYSAVLGIVFLQPRFEKLYSSRHKIKRYLWGLLTVSVAAQIATFPVSVFYFHQFPVYFWISNMLVVPAVMVLIPLGIGLLVINWLPLVSVLISKVISLILSCLLFLLELVENLPNSVLDIYILSWELAFLLAMLFFFFLFIEFRNKVYFQSGLFFMLLFLALSFGIKTVNLFRREIIVYNYTGQYVVHFIFGQNNYIVSEESINESENVNKMINSTVIGFGMKSPRYLTCNEFYNDSILYLNSGFIIFDGKIIRFHSGNKQATSSIIPDIVVGIPENSKNENRISAQMIVSSVLPVNEKFNTLHILREKGAFRESW